MATKKKPVKQPIPKGLARALVERKPNTDSETLLNDVIEVWGGTRRLAQDMFSEFQGSKSGGMTRQRILEMIQRLIITNTTHEIGKTVRPADLSDEELEAMAMKYVKKVGGDAKVSEEARPGIRPDEASAAADFDGPEEGW